MPFSKDNEPVCLRDALYIFVGGLAVIATIWAWSMFYQWQSDFECWNTDGSGNAFIGVPLAVTYVLGMIMNVVIIITFFSNLERIVDSIFVDEN